MATGEPTNPHWPLFDLVVRTPQVELRPPTDDVIVQLADLAAAGIHDPATMPFALPWTDVEPPLLQRNALQWWWRQRAELGPERFSLSMAVFERQPAGEPTIVGVQDVGANDFPRLRQAATGSWLGQAHQGRGIGKEMRAAVLHLAFEGLGAQTMHTDAWQDNAASLAVTASLPYRPNGEKRDLRRDAPDRMLAFRMERADWETVRRDDIVIEGLGPCLGMLGLEDEPTG